MVDIQTILTKGPRTDLARIHYRGIFDLQGLYRMMREWFNEKNFDFYETLHKAKIPELELEWKAERKMTGYIRHYCYISFHFWGLHDIEVVVDGVKKKMNEARVTITFDAEIKTDYEESWEVEKSGMRAKLKYFYENFMIKKELLVNQYDAFIIEIRDLQEKTKDFLGMEGVSDA